MNDEFFQLLIDIGVITVNDLEKLAKIRAYIAKLQQEIADALAAKVLAMQEAAASAEAVVAAQALAAEAQVKADVALQAQLAAEAAFAADQADDATLSAGLTEIVDSIPVEPTP